MDWNVLDKYLVQVGADIDQNSFNSAKSALNELKRSLAGLKKAAAPMALAAAIAAIGKAAYDTIKGVAMADMEYQKLAASMWTTKETAKALSVAMKTMGASKDDIAWVPELRQQFFRLRAEMQRFATPGDADEQLRYIREIGYDIQALFVRLKMLKEWIAYYLIRYLEPYIKDFKAFIKWLSDKLGNDMPGIARKVARAITTVLSPAIQTVKALGLVIGKVYDFIESLPDQVKKWGAIFAAVGLMIMSGPFGWFMMALSAAMILIEDFMFYINGWNSSKALAPAWEAILQFSRGEGAGWVKNIREFLKEVARLAENIFKSVKGLLKEMGKHPTVKKFGEVLLEAVKLPFQMLKLWAGLLLSVIKALNLLIEGEPSAAMDELIKGVAEAKAPDLVKRGMDYAGEKWNSFKTGAKKYFGFGDSGDSGVGSYSPVSGTGYNKNLSNEKVAREAWAEAQRIGKEISVDPALIYGQWYHETLYGGKPFNSPLAREDYNFGGQTTTKDMGPAYKQRDGGTLWYKSYKSMREYAEDFKRQWGKTIAGAKTPEEYAMRLKAKGYYTDFPHVYINGIKNGMKNIPEPPVELKPVKIKQASDSTTGRVAYDMLRGINFPTLGGKDAEPAKTPPVKTPPAETYAGAVLRGRKMEPGGAGGILPGSVTFPAPNVTVNVNKTNATTEDIVAASRDGVKQGMSTTEHIAQRMLRGCTI